MKKIWMIILLLLLIPAVALGEIEVGPGRRYESFTQAVWENIDSGENITVYPGEYDVHQEFTDLFGTTVPERFQHGIFIHDRIITFLPGSKLTCVWYRNDNFSVLYSGGNVTLDGMDLYAEGMMYAIHDDLWHWESAYINQYLRCRVIGKLLTCANCIGGGVAQNARVIIDNCYFDNGVDDSITVRYHNIDLPDAKGQIWISDSYFNGYLAMCYYGGSAHLDVFVNGCRAERIITKFETPDSMNRNIDLYKWNNED